MSIKDQIRAEIERLNKRYLIREYDYGWNNALNAISKFLDTLPEQEHPIYQLNQILLDWMREAKTDKEQEARFEAYKRFFELYDEYMMQEPEEPVSEELEEAAEKYRRNSCNAALRPNVDGPTPEYGGSIKGAFIAGAEWQKEQDLAEMALSKSPLSVAYANRCFENGKQAMKEQMMEKSYLATISANNTIPVLPMKEVSDIGLDYGDKVRVIVIKEDK